MIQLFIGGVDYTPCLMAGSLSIKLEVQDYSADFKLLIDYGQQLYVSQEVIINDNENLIFGGVLSELSYEDYVDEDEKIIASIECSSYKLYSNRHYVDLMLYDITRVDDVVKQYLTSYLSVEGITAGKISKGSKIYDIEDFDMFAKNISQVYDSLKDVDGAEWFIDIDKKLYFSKIIKTPITYKKVIKRGVDIDIMNLKVKRSLENYRNKQIFITGEPDGDEPLPGDPDFVGVSGYEITLRDDYRIQIVRQIDSEIQRMQALNRGSGVWGNVVEDSKVITIEDAIRAIEVLIEKYGHDECTLEFDTFYNKFMPGNFLVVEYPEFNILSGTTFVIDSVEISDFGNGMLNYKLECTQRDTESTNTRKENMNDYFKKMLKEPKIVADSVVFY